MTLSEMMLLCERKGCYWTLSCESLVHPEYACKIFSFRNLCMEAQEVASRPEQAFSKALIQAKIMSDPP